MNPIVKFVAKQLFGQKGVIANNKAVNFEAAKLAEKLSEFGVDPNSIKTEKQLEGIVNQIKAFEKKALEDSMKVVSQDDPRFKGIMDKMLGSNVIKRDFGKPFKEEVKNIKSEIDESIELEKKGKKLSDSMSDKEIELRGNFPKASDDQIKKMLDEEIAKRITKDNQKGIANIRKRQKMLADAIDDASPGFANDIKVDAELVAENLAGRMGKVYDDLSTKERLDLYDQAYTGLSKQRFKNMPEPEDKADGGRIGYRIGGGPIKSFFEFLNKKNPVQAYRDYLKSIKDKTLKANETGKFTDLPIAEVGIPAATGVFINRAVKKRLQAENEKLKEKEPEKKASGGRIGLKMGRRAFLQALGAGLAGTAAVKSGIIGLGGKTAGKEAVKQVVKTPSVAGKPEWFDSLVNKVIREGDDVTKNFATKEREIVHKLDIDDLDDVKVTQDLDEGLIRVEYNSPNNMGEDTVELVFKKGRPEEEGMMPDEFYAVEKEPRGIRTGPDDYDIEFDGENFARSVDDLQSDTSKLKEVATGKKQTLGEFVNSKKKKDKVKSINEDQVEQAEYLETKYGPGPEDADDFASGGIARMLGE